MDKEKTQVTICQDGIYSVNGNLIELKRGDIIDSFDKCEEIVKKTLENIKGGNDG